MNPHSRVRILSLGTTGTRSTSDTSGVVLRGQTSGVKEKI